MKIFAAVCLFYVSQFALGNGTPLDPTITPALFKTNTPITVTYDVTGTSLANLTAAWAWVWIPNGPDAKSNVNPSTSNSSATDPAKFVKSLDNGKTLFTLTFTPDAFFAASISSAAHMGILLKGNDWANGQTSDFVVAFWDGTFKVKLVAPAQQPLFVSNSDVISVHAATPVAADYVLFINDVQVDAQPGLTDYSYQIVVDDTLPYFTVKITATANSSSSSISFNYIISGDSPVLVRPPGIIDGINYSPDNTRATLCLWAPGKTSVYALGDFTNWDVLPSYRMNKDGEHFWIEVTGLTSGVEYAFQYLVDESLKVADPYADKILDPDDQYIPAASYPILKAYPTSALHNEWYFNRLAVLQTGQVDYTWQTPSFQRPEKEKLVIYELLVRDFFDSNNRNYQNLIDTIGYFQRLGVNGIELMPVTEFNGNDSWGYNPTFMFAPDKYYGTKNKLKEFIDACHQHGIAVILDIVLNQQDLPNPYVLMYYDFVTQKPRPDNPWFNVDAPHPFSVFYDLNHESKYTQQYVDTVNYHWLHDYKVDGIRFDLAKGFTQQHNPTDVNAWSAYDGSRIAILKRMSDKIWSYAPDTYVILEHFAANAEEKELAEYRSTEGKGMMLWENFNFAYNQSTMGYSDGSDISGIYYGNKGWSAPHAIGYMESHDEERLMYKNLQFGSASGNYNTKSMNIALARMEAASVLFYTVPGPKMLWEFGELGYDQSINRCADGSINQNCRISGKPVLWSYESVPARKNLFNHIADLNRLRKQFSVFTGGEASIPASTALIKQITIKNKPYTSTPADSTRMNVQIVANMNVDAQTTTVIFPHTGTWYDYYSPGATLEVTSGSQAIALAAGGYKLFTDVRITNQTDLITGIEGASDKKVSVYPNPSADILFVESGNIPILTVSLQSMQAIKSTPVRVSENSWDIRELPQGLYIVEIRTSEKTYRTRLMKK